MDDFKTKIYYVNDNAEGDLSISVHLSPRFGTIPVIEKSAYDKLKSQLAAANLKLQTIDRQWADGTKELKAELECANQDIKERESMNALHLRTVVKLEIELDRVVLELEEARTALDVTDKGVNRNIADQDVTDGSEPKLWDIWEPNDKHPHWERDEQTYACNPPGHYNSDIFDKVDETISLAAYDALKLENAALITVMKRMQATISAMDSALIQKGVNFDFALGLPHTTVKSEIPDGQGKD